MGSSVDVSARKNFILMIGDGFGPGYATFARLCEFLLLILSCLLKIE